MTAARSQNNTHHIDAASEIAASTNRDTGLVGPDSKCRELTRSDSSRLEAADAQSDTHTRYNVSDDLQTAKTDNSPTRTEDTVASYRARWPSLVRMATRQCGSQPPTLELVWAVAQWLADARDGYSPNTYRQYRAALIWVVEQMPAVEDGLQGKIESSLKPEEDQNRGARSQPLEARTSAKKRKRIEEEDFSILCEALCASPVASDRDLLVFFEANLMAGLRPSEWEGTVLSLEATGDVVLKVANGIDAMNLRASIHGAMPPRLRRHTFSETKFVKFDGDMRGSAFVLKGDVHGLRDKSTDGTWSYVIESKSLFRHLRTGQGVAFRRNSNKINGESAIHLRYAPSPGCRRRFCAER